jgi:hypothetical protein
VKDLFVWRRTVRDLTLALAIAFSLILAGFGSALAGKTAPVEIGFLGVPPPHFQNVLLNVQSIRVNPNANAAPNDPKWQRIGVASGIGPGGGNAPELQIDLNNSQNIPQLFNTQKIKPAQYKIAQLILDPNNPGTLIPDCPNAGTPEGCINYPIQLTNAGSPINLIQKTPPLINANNNGLAPLVIQLTMTINTAPIQPGAPYLVTISMAAIVSTSVMGTVSGHVPTGSSANAKHVRKLAVTAEAIGTNTEIASAPVGSDGSYFLTLPAAGGPDPTTLFGTLYDLAVAGGGDSFAATRLPPLYPNASITQDFTGSDAGVKTNQPLGSITGTITDACTGGGKTAIAGATIQILKAPIGSAITDAMCIDPTIAPQCVSVASANTNNAGLFPLPGTLTLPSVFEGIPILTGTDRYSMMITAPGYDPTFTLANATNGIKGGNCNPLDTSKTIMPCNFALNRGTISGTFPIDPPVPGQTILVQVFAEDSGTNNIVSALPNPTTVRSTTASPIDFTINVPTTAIPGGTTLPRTFDLFATTIDTFQGISDPYQGHTIAVIQGVTGPQGTCPAVTGATSFETISCVGHGSVTGTVGNPDLGTSVVLSKTDVHTGKDVQITNTPVQNQLPNTNSSNSFSFCAPGDTYTVQRLQLPKPDQSATPLAAPTPSLTGPVLPVTIPVAPLVGGPTPTPTPALKCPTTCSNPGGTCPGICNNTTLGTEL